VAQSYIETVIVFVFFLTVMLVDKNDFSNILQLGEQSNGWF